jgi:hypothetical protein
MVHLFSVQSRHMELYCLARVTDGVYQVESINGHSAAVFPAILTNKAQRHATARQSHNAPTLNNRVNHCDVEAEVDYSAKLADLEW